MCDDFPTHPVTAAGTAGRRAAPAGLRLGFIPLIDCAPLAVAAEMGFARQEGLDLALVREVSWANIRDKVNLGHLHGAHMLAGMPIATTLGIGHVRVDMLAPLSLGLGGNAITISNDIWRDMRAAGAGRSSAPRERGEALRRVVAQRNRHGGEPLTFAMVFPFSMHNYLLRYWLAASGIDPDRDVRLVVIPPSLMVDSLRAGHIQGFCAGAPWPNLAARAGLGRIVATQSVLWQNSPDKVLGVPRAWAERHPDRLAALVRALYRAGRWADDPANRSDLALLLSSPSYVGIERGLIEEILSGDPDGTDSRQGDEAQAAFMTFHDRCAGFPWRSHALWFYSQMVRWHQVAASEATAATAAAVYRPDLYRAALAPLGAALPAADLKCEGALQAPTLVASTGEPLRLGPDRFFDGRIFDPQRIEAYLEDAAAD